MPAAGGAASTSTRRAPGANGFGSTGRIALPVALAVLPCALAYAVTADPSPTLDELWDQRIAEARELRLWLATAASALLAAGWLLRRTGHAAFLSRGRDALLLGLALATLFAWWHPHQGTLRTWHHSADSFHYYLGSKYFQELGYTRLYQCTVVADGEAGLGPQIARSQIRNLETNRAESALVALRNPARCKQHFTPERWQSFSEDLVWYRSGVTLPFWLGLRGDHGYNPPPTWTMVGSLLTHTGPARRSQIIALTFIDPVLLMGMFVALAWAFGWRVMCIALIYWGTNQPASWEWIGGSILRFDWLAASVVGLCCLKRERPVAAGLLLAWAVGVRIFPIAIVGGLALAALLGWTRARGFVAMHTKRRFAWAFAAGIAGIAVLSSLLVGPESWAEFAKNSRTHLATDTLNRVGLRPLLAYRHEARATVTIDSESWDQYARWRAERKVTFASRRPLFLLITAAYLALLAFAVRRQPDWAIGVLAIGMLPVLLELSSYYYGVLLAFACLWPEREDLGAGLLLLSSASWWGGTWLGPDRDLLSAGSSLAILLFVGFATLRMTQGVSLLEGGRLARR